jgi:hypothetical protein
MAETYTGHVRNGMVVFEGAIPPEGTPVRVEPVPVVIEEDDAIVGTRRLLLGWARRAEAVAPPLPSDMADEHDHHAHGKPRS